MLWDFKNEKRGDFILGIYGEHKIYIFLMLKWKTHWKKMNEYNTKET